jgi:putative ABC transport system permease protein
MIVGIDLSLGQVAASLVLVLIAVAISRWSNAELEADIGIAVLRSFVQLTAIGYVIQVIFDDGSLVFVFALLVVMVGFGTLTARGRARKVPSPTLPLLIALSIAAISTVGLVVALGIFAPEARYLVPVGGMVIGNAMTASEAAPQIEATLALGATARQAAAPQVRNALRSGTIALIDSTKTTGLIFFPGTMVGMLLAGAEPIDAVRLQLILLWVLLGAVAISALVSTTLAYRNFFTDAQQLRDPPPP